MPKPICAQCSLPMSIARMGVTVEFTRRERKDQLPYQKWMGDLLQCPGCGATVVAAYGHQPVEHFQINYTGLKADYVIHDL